jgi:hypothetical protein
MNIENLSQTEIKTLHTLFGKLLEEPQQKVYLDPVNKYIDDIMVNFNFHKVYQTMEALEWRWATVNGGKSTPNIDELRTSAERLLRGAAKSRLGTYKDAYWELGIINATGGFQATAFCDKAKTQITGLDLKFIVSEWDEGDNEE